MDLEEFMTNPKEEKKISAQTDGSKEKIKKNKDLDFK